MNAFLFFAQYIILIIAESQSVVNNFEEKNMVYKYALTENIAYDEDNNPHSIYGIKAINSNGETIKAYSDVFFDREEAEQFVRRCNDGELSLIHLQDVVEDAVTAQCTL